MHSIESGKESRNGVRTKLLKLIARGLSFGLNKEILKDALKHDKYISKSKEKVEEFIDEFDNPLLVNKKIIPITINV